MKHDPYLMHGPFPLFPLAVDIMVPCHVRGVYCLARTPGGPVCRVAVAGYDLREELKSSATEYRTFWYEPCVSDGDAYRTACRVYHSFAGVSPRQDHSHPQLPAGCETRCPVCGK